MLACASRGHGVWIFCASDGCVLGLHGYAGTPRFSHDGSLLALHDSSIVIMSVKGFSHVLHIKTQLGDASLPMVLVSWPAVDGWLGCGALQRRHAGEDLELAGNAGVADAGASLETRQAATSSWAPMDTITCNAAIYACKGAVRLVSRMASSSIHMGTITCKCCHKCL